MSFCHLWTFACTEKDQTGYAVSTGSGQTLQQAPKFPESAEIMKNQASKPIVAYLLMPHLILSLHLVLETKKTTSVICREVGNSYLY